MSLQSQTPHESLVEVEGAWNEEEHGKAGQKGKSNVDKGETAQDHNGEDHGDHVEHAAEEHEHTNT